MSSPIVFPPLSVECHYAKDVSSFPSSPQAVSRSDNHYISNIENNNYHDESNRRTLLFERLFLLFCIVVWYLLGVVAIVTSKILLTDWKVPPMLLTFQQLLLASTVLRFVLQSRSQGLAGMPWHQSSFTESDDYGVLADATKCYKKPTTLSRIWQNHADFLLTGFFNALDFLASNIGFSHAAASFVETIKSSDPLCTAIVALAWNVDHLTKSEAASLVLLCGGVMLSTWSSSSTEKATTNAAFEISPHLSSVDSASAFLNQHQMLSGGMIVMSANFCFAFRALFQKRYRAATAKAISSPTSLFSGNKLDDPSLLCRMQQTGAAALLIPVVLAYTGFVLQAVLTSPHQTQMLYLAISMVNTICYASYT